MKDRVVTFQGHHNYIVSIAKLCKENNLFTDVVILCDDGKLVAHRIVLAAVSPFLRHVLDNEAGQSTAAGQTTIVMPDVRRGVVQQLLDFLYTGIMKLSPSATWEFQQLVSLLEIDPQNVGVDTISSDSKCEKPEPSPDKCQILSIKLAHTADISDQPIKLSPLNSHNKPPPIVQKLTPKSSKSTPLTNGVSGSSTKSPPSNSLQKPHKPSDAIAVSPKLKITETKSGKSKPEKTVNPIKLVIPSGSLIRSSNETVQNNKSNSSDYHHHVTSSTNFSNSGAADAASDSTKVNTRKRPLSEKIDYKDMMADEETIANKKSRGGKARAKSGGVRGGAGGGGAVGGKVGGSGRGGKVGRGSRRDDVVCAICNQFDPSLPSAYTGNKTEWIGCDCNRWFHKFCTRLKEVDDSFSCRLVHKTCLQPPLAQKSDPSS